jgi:hypothetical protein
MRSGNALVVPRESFQTDAPPEQFSLRFMLGLLRLHPFSQFAYVETAVSGKMKGPC